jgi:hypothetical protein
MNSHFKIFTLVLVFLALSQGFLLAQYNYSPEISKSISEKRQEEKIAHDEWNRGALYELGIFHLNIYNKYKDTSLHAAIRCFTQSCFTEGELMDERSLKAAWNLGRIYENADGIKPDSLLSMIYYFISDSLGSTDLERTRAKFCTDSLVMSINPFCDLGSATSIDFFEKLGREMQMHPGRSVHFTLRIPNEFINSYYNYWLKTHAFNKFSSQANKYMGDIDPGRFSYEIVYGENKTLLLTIVITAS